MSEGKKYYWLKLHRDFFKRHDIRIIEGMPNGKDYILFYLKLLCESVDHDGKLRFSESIPYDEKMLATITYTNIDVVRAAVQLFTGLGMMGIMDDGTYFMFQAQKMIGYETDWAKKKREYRELQAGQSEDNTRTMLGQSEDKAETDRGQIEDNVRTMSSECPQDVRTMSSECPDIVRTMSDKSKRKRESKSESYTVSTAIETEIPINESQKKENNDIDHKSSSRAREGEDGGGVGKPLCFNEAWRTSTRARAVVAQNIIDRIAQEGLPASNLSMLQGKLFDAMANGIDPQELLVAARHLDDIEFPIWVDKATRDSALGRHEKLTREREALDASQDDDPRFDEIHRMVYGRT